MSRRGGPRDPVSVPAAVESSAQPSASMLPASAGEAIQSYVANRVNRTLMAATFTADHHLLSANHPFRQAFRLGDEPLACRLEDCFDPGSRGDLALVYSTDPRAPVANFLRSRDRELSVSACLYRLPECGLLLGEAWRPSDLELLDGITAVASELARLGGQLRTRNTELQAVNERVVALTRTDPLTGLANRRFLDERLAVLLSQADRHERPLSLVVSDIDHFKQVNDQHGHPAGDQVLRCFAGLLARESRTEDVTARLGGEEFVVVLPDTGLEAATAYAERVRSALMRADPLDLGVVVTASFGVAERESHEDAESLLQRADDALYTAKRAGRNRTHSAAARGGD
ncbi:MAG: GGDEF domain-containing protein [Ectothiorhodospiraceae bacterium]|nr:GGDEF domain-containing protein [Chromatiales bacterium]MCP5155414.1 GGDEF domain-containing protein [Ectothiorhodospiraceae bacterium]